MKNTFKIFALILCTSVFSQEESKDKLPYYEVPEYSKEFTAGTMAARMVDALGFRFYWASNDLTEKDLAYKLNEDGRSTTETIDHIYDLSKIIVNSTLKKPNSRISVVDQPIKQGEKANKSLVSILGTVQVPLTIKLIIYSVFVSCLFLLVYYFIGPNGVDIVGFFEIAFGYSANLSVLPIERHPATLLFLFLLFLNFFIGRVELNQEDSRSHTNLLWLGFCWIVASYFIARSHFNNVFNLLPIFLFCLCKYKTAIPSINMIQKVGIMTIGIFAVGIAVNASVINYESLSKRITSRELLSLPKVRGLNPTTSELFNNLVITEPRPTAIVTHFHEAHDWIAEFEGGGYALPLVPANHFYQVPEARKNTYWKRLLERNPEYYLLCHPISICADIYRPNFVDFKELNFPDVSEKSNWQYFLVKMKTRN